jgi:hypothetical protein
MVHVEGRTSAVGYGHVEIQGSRLLCHVAKGGPCSEYSRRSPTKGAKYCDHTLLALWGLKGNKWRDCVRAQQEIVAARGEKDQVKGARPEVKEKEEEGSKDEAHLLGFLTESL